MNAIQKRYVKARGEFHKELKGKKSVEDMPNKVVGEFINTEQELYHWATNSLRKRGYTDEQIDLSSRKANWMLEIKE